MRTSPSRQELPLLVQDSHPGHRWFDQTESGPPPGSSPTGRCAMTTSIFDGTVALDRRQGLAAHQQIERWFVDVLGTRNLRPGDRLPPEAEVARFFGVSRMTLRQALSGLAARGLLERIPGRSGGTFVLEPAIDCDLTGLTGFTEQLRRADIKASAKVLTAQTVPADRQVAAALALRRGAQVHEIVRIRLAN